MLKTNLLKIYSRLSQLLGFVRLNTGYLYIGYFYHHTRSTYRHLHQKNTIYTQTHKHQSTPHTHTHTHAHRSAVSLINVLLQGL